jgi:hypothetical protein
VSFSGFLAECCDKRAGLAELIFRELYFAGEIMEVPYRR